MAAAGAILAAKAWSLYISIPVRVEVLRPVLLAAASFRAAFSIANLSACFFRNSITSFRHLQSTLAETFTSPRSLFVASSQSYENRAAVMLLQCSPPSPFFLAMLSSFQVSLPIPIRSCYNACIHTYSLPWVLLASGALSFYSFFFDPLPCRVNPLDNPPDRAP